MVRRLVFCLDCEGVFYTDMKNTKRSKKICPNCSSIGTLKVLTIEYDNTIQCQF